jgi:hypothetical protein
VVENLEFLGSRTPEGGGGFSGGGRPAGSRTGAPLPPDDGGDDYPDAEAGDNGGIPF